MSKPQQPGNPQARPAFQAPSLPTHPQEQDGDEEGTVLSTHNATHYAANTFDADEEARYSARIRNSFQADEPTVPMAQPCRRNRRNPLQHNSRYHNRNRLP